MDSPLTAVQKAELEKTAEAIVNDGHGLLAADESIGSMEKRFKKIGTVTPTSPIVHHCCYSFPF